VKEGTKQKIFLRCQGLRSIVSNGSRFRSGRDWHWDWDWDWDWDWGTLFTVDLVITYRWHHPLNHDLPVMFSSVSLFSLD
jgi:hypothetical protein